MYFFTLFILLIWFNAESYLCVKYFLQNSASSSIHMKKKITHTESIFIDYNIISNLDLTSLKTVSLKDKGSIFLEDGKKILINNDLSVKTQSNQIQCASATFTNELNKTG